MEIIVNYLPGIQILLSILLVAIILIQQSDAGIGGALGGGGGAGPSGSSFNTKRGIEKTLFKITIVIAILFVLSAFLDIIIY